MRLTMVMRLAQNSLCRHEIVNVEHWPRGGGRGGMKCIFFSFHIPICEWARESSTKIT